MILSFFYCSAPCVSPDHSYYFQANLLNRSTSFSNVFQATWWEGLIHCYKRTDLSITLDGYICGNSHCWPPLIICQPRKNFRLSFLFPFAANEQKFAVSIFCLQKRNESCRFPLVPFSVCRVPETWRHGHGDLETWRWRHGNMDGTWRHGDMVKRKTEAQPILLIPFTVCSSCKQKFVFSPFVDRETIRSYPFAKGLNRLNGLAHLGII